MNLITF